MANDPKRRLPPTSLDTPSLCSQGATLAVSSAEWPREARLAVLALGLLGAGLLALGLLGAGLLWLNARGARPAPAPPVVVTTQCVEPQAREPFAEPAAPPTPPPVFLADGSMVELHGAVSRLFTEEESSEEVRLRLWGGATFAVVPNQARSFMVSNGQVVVRSLGTAFSMDPEGARTLVAVERGRVQILWPRGAAILSAGEAAIFPPQDEPAFVSRASIVPSKRALRLKRARHARSRTKSRAKKIRLASR